MSKALPKFSTYERLLHRVHDAKIKEAEAKAAHSEAKAERKRLEHELKRVREDLRLAVQPADSSSSESPKIASIEVKRPEAPLRLPPRIQEVVDTLGELQTARRIELQEKLGCSDNAVWSRIQKTKALGLMESKERGLYALTDKGKAYQTNKLRAVRGGEN